MARTDPKFIKQRLLHQRGMASTLGTVATHYLVNVPVSNVKKTPLMRLLEIKYGHGNSIQEILLSGSLSFVAKRLGNEVDVTTLSKWIKLFKLRFTKDNLPICKGCLHYQSAKCEVGICVLLTQMEEWDLVIEKRKEILG